MESQTSSELIDAAADAAKEYAPWREGLAWWIILVEGIALALIGVLMLLDPRGASENIALIFTGALALAGILQLWDVFRNRTPEKVDSIVSARASIGVFAGLVALFLFFRGFLTLPVGLIVVGTACLVFGLIGVALIFMWKSAARWTAILETVLFLGVGLLMLYAQAGGGEAITTGTQIIAWIALVGGVGLIVFAFVRRNEQQEVETA